MDEVNIHQQKNSYTTDFITEEELPLIHVQGNRTEMGIGSSFGTCHRHSESDGISKEKSSADALSFEECICTFSS